MQNWALVSDILNGSAALKGVARRPDKCMEHYKVLLERQAAGDGGDDALNIPKSAARTLLQRAGLLEDSVMVRTVHLPLPLSKGARSGFRCVGVAGRERLVTRLSR